MSSALLKLSDFSNKILNWYDNCGRHDLPWQQHPTVYRVWISEIMLQQTQVSTVIPYYHRFMQRFPDVSVLALADVDEVLHLWSGLGYYSRARNLHRTAAIVVNEYQGVFPETVEELQKLPGIGRSTAGAILSLGLNQPHPVLDGNVKRVLCRYNSIKGWPGSGPVEKQLWTLAGQLLSVDRPAAYTQAIMDLGATVCVRSFPLCNDCPVSPGCLACKQGLQNELPHKREKKKPPVKQLHFIMIEGADGEILLQKRPPAGIWGGLWGFPECPLETDLVSWVHEKFGYSVNSITYEPELKHTFTHFQLRINPVRMRLESAPAGIRDSDDLYWFKPGGSNKTLGMAAPVKKLIENVFLK